jgi:hypothetical protein
VCLLAASVRAVAEEEDVKQSAVTRVTGEKEMEGNRNRKAEHSRQSRRERCRFFCAGARGDEEWRMMGGKGLNGYGNAMRLGGRFVAGPTAPRGTCVQVPVHLLGYGCVLARMYT